MKHVVATQLIFAVRKVSLRSTSFKCKSLFLTCRPLHVLWDPHHTPTIPNTWINSTHPSDCCINVAFQGEAFSGSGNSPCASSTPPVHFSGSLSRLRILGGQGPYLTVSHGIPRLHAGCSATLERITKLEAGFQSPNSSCLRIQEASARIGTSPAHPAFWGDPAQCQMPLLGDPILHRGLLTAPHPDQPSSLSVHP